MLQSLVLQPQGLGSQVGCCPVSSVTVPTVPVFALVDVPVCCVVCVPVLVSVSSVSVSTVPVFAFVFVPVAVAV